MIRMKSNETAVPTDQGPDGKCGGMGEVDGVAGTERYQAESLARVVPIRAAAPVTVHVEVRFWRFLRFRCHARIVP
jgi:hypothetical protein